MKERKSKKKIEEIIKIPEGVNFKVDRHIEIKGEKGTLKREKKSKSIDIIEKDKKIIISSKKITKREREKVGSTKAHIKNMIKGITSGHTYKLKICSSHFPMNVSVENDKFIVKNFLGEKIPRTLKFSKDSSVKIEGSEVIIEGIDKEIISQIAAGIEQLCKIRNKDKRIFQDGIFIINKDGKEIK